MKALIPILIGLLVVGCGKAKQPTNTTQDNNTKAKPVKEITKKDIVGTYELESDGNILRRVFLENGDFESYKNNEKTHSFTWKIYVQDELGEGVWVIDKDSSITRVAYLIDGKSQEWAAQNQETYKKFQSEKKGIPSKNNDGAAKPTEEKNPELTKSVSSKLIADPIVEKAIRGEIEKFTGELTKTDLKKVRELYLVGKQLTDVKGLEKLTQLTMLYLEGNPALTKAQIDELQ